MYQRELAVSNINFIIIMMMKKSKRILSQTQRQQLKECFDKYCTTKVVKKPPKSRLNANGVREVTPSQPEITTSLNQTEFSQIFREAGIILKQPALRHIYGQACKAKSKGIDFVQLCEIMELEDGTLDSQDELRQLFQSYDRQGRGYFDYNDYFYICQGIGKKLSEAQIRTAFQKIDLQGKGKISFQNFIKIMKNIK